MSIFNILKNFCLVKLGYNNSRASVGKLRPTKLFNQAR